MVAPPRSVVQAAFSSVFFIDLFLFDCLGVCEHSYSSFWCSRKEKYLMVVGQEGALGTYRLGGSARRAPLQRLLRRK